MTAKKEETYQVAIVMGSDSDLEVMLNASRILDDFNVPHVVEVASAHRSPRVVRKLVKQWEKEGVQIIIAGAGCAAHLPGVIAGETHLPVIGVPLASPPFNGFDSVMAMVPMPAGVPVATMAVGKSGATNAAVLSVRILALHNPILGTQLMKYMKGLEKKVNDKRKKLKVLGPKEYLKQK